MLCCECCIQSEPLQDCSQSDIHWFLFLFVCFNLIPQFLQTSSLEKSVLPVIQKKLALQQWIFGEQLWGFHLGTGNRSKFHERMAKYNLCKSPASGFFHYCLLVLQSLPKAQSTLGSTTDKLTHCHTFTDQFRHPLPFIKILLSSDHITSY